MLSILTNLPDQFLRFLLSPALPTLLWWWAWLLAAGIVMLPLARRLFRFPLDAAYPFAKILGILLPVYAAWLAGSLHLSSLAGGGRFVAVGAMLAVSFAGWRMDGGEPRTALPPVPPHFPLKVIALEEALFLCCLLGWAFIRSFHPSVEGLEKFMDFGFVNTAVQATSMPPEDMWLAGSPVNYYYFGHVVCATLAIVTGIPTEVAYNLMIASLFAFTVVGSFSVVAAAIGFLHHREPHRAPSLQRLRRIRGYRAVLGGLIAAALVAGGGNLHALVHGYVLPAAHDLGLTEQKAEPYWYPDATRYIGYHPETDDKTIHEFPIYSFVVADLHGHVSDIPAVLTTAALLLATVQHGPSRIKTVVGGVLLGVMYITNAWDLPIYLCIWLGALAFAWLKRESFQQALLDTAKGGVLLFALAMAVSSPFLLHFEHFSEGVGLVHAHTPLWQLLVLWGDKLLFAGLLALLLLVLWTKTAGGEGRFLRFWRGLQRPDLFALGLAVSGLALIAAPEIVYVKDIYGNDFHRCNTMFKLVYQAFILLGLLGGYVTVRIVSVVRGRALSALLILLLGAAVTAPLLYTPQAMAGFYPLRKESKSLDGLTFLHEDLPGDAAAVQWLRSRLPGQPVILEAEGDSYSRYGRISMATGLPTVLGWYAHEWLWHNDPDLPARRRQEVRAVYTNPSGERARQVLEDYGIRYIVIGELERERYEDLDEQALHALGDVAFQSGDTTLIEISLRSRPDRSPHQ